MRLPVEDALAHGRRRRPGPDRAGAAAAGGAGRGGQGVRAGLCAAAVPVARHVAGAVRGGRPAVTMCVGVMWQYKTTKQPICMGVV